MNVWKTTHINAPSSLNIPISNCSDYYELASSSLNFGIVGFGPKGFSALASLQKTLEHSTSIKPVQLHLFNSHRFFAAGPNYSPDQPEYLLINYSIEHINAWTEPESDDPDKLTFMDWIAKYANSHNHPKAEDFASRALMGLYLQDALKIVLQKLPENISVLAFQGEVTGCQVDHSNSVCLELDHIAFHPEIRYASVILTTGHLFPNSTPKGLEYNPYFISEVYPTKSWLQSITNHDRVAINGLGLTFVDAVLALTEGKGGEFIEENGQMTYQASGLEPKEIFAFSRSGIPMIPRSGKSPKFLAELEFFGSKAEKRLDQLHGQIDFERDILPLIKAEMEAIWYLTLIERGPKTGEWFSLFNFQELVNPLPEECYSCGDFYQSEMEKITDFYLKELEEEPSKSLIQQVASVWRRLLPKMISYYNSDGFTQESQERFEKYYLVRFNQISFGPPSVSMRKIHSLIKNGYLNYHLGRSPEIETTEDLKFRISSSENGFVSICDYVIQAGIQNNQFPHRNSSLYEDLFKRGLASCKNPDKESNCPNINHEGQLISRTGAPIPQITLFGTPTEGITLDNDPLSRTKNDFASKWSSQTVKILESEKSQYTYEHTNSKQTLTEIYSDY